jgi:tetratricopeptide (TPR) repeat protein
MDRSSTNRRCGNRGLLPSLTGDFIFDDDLLLTHSALIKSPDGLYRFWCTNEAFDYWPVTNSTLWLEWRLWGLQPTGYRVTNLILHIADSLLIWLVLRKLRIPGAWLAALLFAVHPVNAESVAWIAQRKNLLALFFFLLSILWWLKGEERPLEQTKGRQTKGRQSRTTIAGATFFNSWYWLSLSAFILAMLSKGSVAILPLMLLLMVWWQRDRITWQDVFRFLPFFAVAAVLTAVDVWFQTRGSGDIIRHANFLQRLLGAGAVVWFYLAKALLPINLMFVYPDWDIQPGNLLWWLPLLAAVAVTIGLWWQRNRSRWMRGALLAWLYFCVALLPAMGFTDVGYMRHSLVADHYQHIAIIGVLALVAATLCFGNDRFLAAKKPVALVAGMIAVILTFLTWRQASLYGNPLALYENSVERNPNSWLLQTNVGMEFAKIGEFEKAITHYEAALNLNPICAPAQLNWGDALVNLNRPSEAIPHYQRAIEILPVYSDAHYLLGMALEAVGRPADAELEYRKTLELQPDYPQAHHSLGLMLASRHQFPEAIDHFQQAVQVNPDFLQAYVNLASTCAAAERYSEAIASAQQALKLAQAAHDAQLAAGISARLKFYRDRLSETEAASGNAAKP